MYLILLNKCLVFRSGSTPNNAYYYCDLPLRKPSYLWTSCACACAHFLSLSHSQVKAQKLVTAARDLSCHFFVIKMPYFWMCSIQLQVP